MNKSDLKALFINAKLVDAKYVGVKIQTEGSSRPEIIINPRENFSAKFDYYMEAYDDDLILISAKGKKDIRITGAAFGNAFVDIETQLVSELGSRWKRLIADTIDRTYDKMIAKTPPKTEEEKIHCEGMRESIKGLFINGSRTELEARFICEHIEEYEELFDICMNGDYLAFKRGLVKMQRMQNEYVLKHEDAGEERKGDE